MTLQDYIKLAEEADDSACHVINAMAEKYPLGADFERYNDDIRKMVEFCSDERNTAMAKALIEAEEALRECKDEFWDEWHSHMSEGDFDNHYMIMSIDKALAQIQALNGGEE